MYEVSKLKQRHKLLLKEMNAVPASPLPVPITSKASKGVGKPPTDSSEILDANDAILI